MIGLIPSFYFTSGGAGMSGLGDASAGSGYSVSDDGTVSAPDGTPVGTMSADGTLTANDGTTIAPDGTTTAPDGTVTPPAVVPQPVTSAVPATIQPSQSMQSEIDGFLLNTPNPKSADIVDFLKLYRGKDRLCAAQALIARGLNPHMIVSALRHLGMTGALPSMLYNFISLLVASAVGYHGVRRNHGSVGWGVLWFAAGAMFPVLSSVVALGQGYAKPRPIG